MQCKKRFFEKDNSGSNKHIIYLEYLVFILSLFSIVYFSLKNEIYYVYFVLLVLTVVYVAINLKSLLSKIQKLYYVLSSGVVFLIASWFANHQINSIYGIDAEYLEYSILIVSGVFTLLSISTIIFCYTLFIHIIDGMKQYTVLSWRILFPCKKNNKFDFHLNFNIFLQAMSGFFVLMAGIGIIVFLEKEKYLDIAVYIDSYTNSECNIGIPTNNTTTYIKKNSKECYQVEFISIKEIKYTCLLIGSREPCVGSHP